MFSPTIRALSITINGADPYIIIYYLFRCPLIPAVPDLNHHAAAATVVPVDVAADGVAAVVPALGHRLGLGRLDGFHPAVSGHLFLGEVLHRVGDAGPVRVVRLGRDPHRLGVIVLAAPAGHAPVSHLAAAAVPDGR